MADHKCQLKLNLDKLAAEIIRWEDDIRPRSKPTRNHKNMYKSPRKGTQRESFGRADQVPVSARKARWEELMAQATPNSKQTNHTGKQPKLPLVRELQNLNETKNSIVPSKNIVRSSISQPERERRERMAELAELRSRCLIGLNLPSRAEQENDSVLNISKEIIEPVKEIKDTEVFSLPPPPSPEPMDQDPIGDDAPPIETKDAADSILSIIPNTPSSITDAELPEPTEHEPIAESKVNDETLLPFVSTDEAVHPELVNHAYFSRPKFGEKRLAVETSNLSTSDETTGIFVRQRSVTFEAPPGTAPGDSTSEFGADSEADSISCDSRQLKALSEEKTPQFDPTAFHGSSDHSEDGDSELSAYLDTALEAAAAEASFSHGDGHSSHFTASDSDDQVCSDTEAVVNRLNSFGQNGSLHRHPSQSSMFARKRSFGRSTSGSRRQSGTISDALLDACHLTPTERTTCVQSDQNQSSASRIALIQRRLARLDELPGLIQYQSQLINKTGAILHKCTSAHAVKSSHNTPKRSRQNMNVLVGSMKVAYVQACRTLLIACQTHRVLMEELAMLHRGSTVLVPPTRGDPIRARLKLRAIRLDLKQFMKPGDPTSGGGYVFIPTASDANALGSIDASVTQYCLLAILKCRGEGRLFHTEMATVVRASDLPVGSRRIATHVDLPANFEILPLRPDFSINLEVYCLRLGADTDDWPSFDSPQLLKSNPSTRSSTRSHAKSALSACLPTSHLLLSPFTLGGKSSSANTPNKLSAFTLLSSVDIRYHDDMLLGRLRTEETRHKGDASSSDRQILPLRLLRLPKSTPLTGTVGLIDASVQLEARILTRGFLTVFEEVGGSGVWCRYWCQLRADHLQFWRDPEDEQRSLQDGCTEKPTPSGRIDFRQVAAPRAVPAPRRICARENAVYMRSLLAIEPGWLSASVNASSSSINSDESILFRASSDYTWLEQKHLLCADTTEERDNWIMWFNFCLDALNNWMPAHYSSLAHYDARLQFSQPVSAKLAALILHG